MTSRTFWLENLRKYRALSELQRSAFFADCGKQINRFLVTPQIIPCPAAFPRLGAFLRVVQWNIEKGTRLSAILQQLQTNGILKWADVIILNEADQGMIRSGNRHIARDLAESLKMHMAFGPAHFELTKGTGEELLLEGENRESLQGNAILSRYPILEACIVPLPVSFEPYEFHEKRFGQRNCLWIRLQLKKDNLWIGSTHLELRNKPGCRARQITHIMKNLPGGETEMYLLGGDLNSNSFKRGTAWRTFQSVSRLLFNSQSKVKEQLLHPETGREPLFDSLYRHGFFWTEFNSNEETARTAINSLEEIGYFPAFILNGIKRRLDPYHGYLCFKLDWLLGKNIRGFGGVQIRDPETGVLSVDPGCLKGKNSGPDRISDHLPIYADLNLG